MLDPGKKAGTIKNVSTRLRYMDIRRKDRKWLEEDPVAKRKDSIYLFSKHRDVAIIASLGNVPAIRHLLQHSRWNNWRIDVLCGDEGKKVSVKMYEIVIY